MRIKEGDTANQLMKAIATAVSNLAQWLTLHLSRSLMSTVIPADAEAAAKVSVDVTCNNVEMTKIGQSLCYCLVVAAMVWYFGGGGVVLTPSPTVKH